MIYNCPVLTCADCCHAWFPFYHSKTVCLNWGTWVTDLFLIVVRCYWNGPIVSAKLRPVLSFLCTSQNMDPVTTECLLKLFLYHSSKVGDGTRSYLLALVFPETGILFCVAVWWCSHISLGVSGGARDPPCCAPYLLPSSYASCASSRFIYVWTRSLP